MRRRTLLPALALGVLVLVGTRSLAEDGPKDWYAEAVAAGEIDDAAYRERMAEIVADVNASREGLAGVGALVWDVQGSEGHFRHARWLLHHMKEPWNSGGVTNFHDEAAGSELGSDKGRTAAVSSLIAFKYLERRGPFQPCDRWLPTVVKRFPWILRSAKTVYAGFAEGTVPTGAKFAGRRWGVVVLATDASFGNTRSREDRANREPVVCPRDGAVDVPLELLRDSPDIVPKQLDGGDGTKKKKHGFPLTFSFFGSQAVLAGAEVKLVRIEEVVVEAEKPRRRPPGKKKKKKKTKKPTKPKTETVVTAVDCYVSTPIERPLLKRAGANSNSVVVIPFRPLEPGATYRATLTCRTGSVGGDPEAVEVVTTFKTVAKTKKK